MTWVSGQCQAQDVVTKLTQLICGETTDASGTSVASGDQWIRENVGHNGLCSPLLVSTGDMPNRAGYFMKASGFGNTLSGDTYVRATSICTGVPFSGWVRWLTIVNVSFANSVAGDYSTCSGTYVHYNLDTGSNVSGSWAANSAGAVTSLGVSGLALEVKNPATGFAETGSYIRAFNTTYPGGVDYWPMLYRKGPTSTVTYVSPPSGTVVTDYDVVHEHTSANLALFSPTYTVSFQFGSVASRSPAGNFLSGLGIKTNTGLSGSLYTVAFQMSEQKIRLVDSTSAGGLFLEVGCGWANNPLTSTLGRMNGFRMNEWMRYFLTPSQVLSTSTVQYWMSVKANHIFIILNGDPAQTGKLGTGGVFRFNPTSLTDLIPWGWSMNYRNYIPPNGSTQDHNAVTQYFAYDQARAAGNPDLSRDWQRGWMRPEFLVNASSHGDNNAHNLYAVGQDSWAPTFEVQPSGVDGKWWMYGYTWSDEKVGAGQYLAASVLSYFRGRQSDFWYIPQGNWSSGDELSDTATSRQFFLVQADYVGLSARQRTSGSSPAYVGGVAIEEL